MTYLPLPSLAEGVHGLPSTRAGYQVPDLVRLISAHNLNIPTDQINFDDLESVIGWLPSNDAVMGAMSTRCFRYDPAGHAVFEGEVSLERNGGFASVCAAQVARGAPETLGYVLSVLGDGKRNAPSMATSLSSDRSAYFGNSATGRPKRARVWEWLIARVRNCRIRPAEPAAKSACACNFFGHFQKPFPVPSYSESELH